MFRGIPSQSRPKGHTLVPDDTLRMLNEVLKTAFRLHCTGETVCGKGPWQLVRDVQHKLQELSRRPAGMVSEERVTRFVAKELSVPARPGLPTLKLIGTT
jgi:hypothetical protein